MASGLFVDMAAGLLVDMAGWLLVDMAAWLLVDMTAGLLEGADMAAGLDMVLEGTSTVASYISKCSIFIFAKNRPNFVSIHYWLSFIHLMDELIQNIS